MIAILNLQATVQCNLMIVHEYGHEYRRLGVWASKLVGLQIFACLGARFISPSHGWLVRPHDVCVWSLPHLLICPETRSAGQMKTFHTQQGSANSAMAIFRAAIFIALGGLKIMLFVRKWVGLEKPCFCVRSHGTNMPLAVSCVVLAAPLLFPRP